MDIFSCYQVPALLNTRDEGRGGELQMTWILFRSHIRKSLHIHRNTHCISKLSHFSEIHWCQSEGILKLDGWLASLGAESVEACCVHWGSRLGQILFLKIGFLWFLKIGFISRWHIWMRRFRLHMPVWTETKYWTARWNCQGLWIIIKEFASEWLSM